MNQFPMNTGFNPYDHNMRVVKDYFKRPIVLAYAIFFAVASLLPLLTMLFMSNADLYFTLLEIGDNSIYYDQVSAVKIAIMFLSIIPLLLSVAAFIIYAKSKNPSTTSKPNAGFTMIWVIKIIQLVLMSVFTLILIVGLIVAFTEFSSAYSYYSNYSYYSYYYESSSSIYTGLIVGIIIVAIIFALMIIAMANDVRYWSSVRKSATGLELVSKGAGFTGVWNIILAVIGMLIVVGYIQAVQQPSYYRGSSTLIWVLCLSQAAMVVSYVLYAVIAFGYNGYIKQQRQAAAFGGGNPAYGYGNQIYGNPAPDARIGYNYNPAAAQNNFGVRPPYYPPAPAPVPPQPNPPVNNFGAQPMSDQVSSEPVPSEPQQDMPEKNSDDLISRDGINMNIGTINLSENPFDTTAPADHAQTEVCPQCGNQVEPNYVFCDKCGFKVH